MALAKARPHRRAFRLPKSQMGKRGGDALPNLPS